VLGIVEISGSLMASCWGNLDGFSLGVDEGFLLCFALGFCDGLPSYLLVVAVLNRNLYPVFDNKQNDFG